MVAIELLSSDMLVKLGEKGIKTLDDLGDLASDELIEIVGADAMNEDTANEVIMAARAHWFADEGGDEAGEAPSDQSGEASPSGSEDQAAEAETATEHG